MKRSSPRRRRSKVPPPLALAWPSERKTKSISPPIFLLRIRRVRIVGAMNPNEVIPVVIRLLEYNLPAMVAMIAGMVWTNATWHRHPPAARWTMLAFVWMFFTYLLAIGWHTFGVWLLLHNNLLDDETPYLMALSCCEALGYVFFMV